MELIKITLEKENDEQFKLLKDKLEECCFLKQRVEIILDLQFLPSNRFVYQIFTLFFDYKTAFLKEIKYLKEPSIEVINRTLHNGEQLIINKPTILVGDIHKEAVLYVSNNVYVSGKVEGTVYIYKPKGAIFAEEFLYSTLIFENDVLRVVSGKKLYYDNLIGGKSLWRVLSL